MLARHDFELFDLGQALLPEDLGNTSFEPVATLQAQLPGKQRREVVLMDKVVAMPEELASHRCTRAL
jgi:hypothetical protein